MLRGHQWRVVLCWQGPYISESLFVSVTNVSRSFLIIFNRSSKHRLQLGFMNDFISPIGFICFTTLNVIYLHRPMREVVDLKCYTKWGANESVFFIFEKTFDIEEMTAHSFLDYLLCVTYINSVTHG